MQNIKLEELLGKNAAEKDYAVSTNWRIDFSGSPEFATLLGSDAVVQHMQYACHSDFTFEAATEFANATIKGIPINQAAWQSRAVADLSIEIYEPMDRAVELALLNAQNNGAGFLRQRNLSAKSTYTFSGIALHELGNWSGTGEPEVIDDINFLGAQIKKVRTGSFASKDASIVSTELSLYLHGWYRSSETEAQS